MQDNLFVCLIITWEYDSLAGKTNLHRLIFPLSPWLIHNCISIACSVSRVLFSLKHMGSFNINEEDIHMNFKCNYLLLAFSTHSDWMCEYFSVTKWRQDRCHEYSKCNSSIWKHSPRITVSNNCFCNVQFYITLLWWSMNCCTNEARCAIMSRASLVQIDTARQESGTKNNNM